MSNKPGTVTIGNLTKTSARIDKDGRVISETTVAPGQNKFEAIKKERARRLGLPS